jgi:hypothetical protein
LDLVFPFDLDSVAAARSVFGPGASGPRWISRCLVFVP